MHIHRTAPLCALVVFAMAHSHSNGSEVADLRRKSFDTCNAVRSGVASVTSERSLTTERGTLTQRASFRTAFDMDQSLLMYCVTEATVDLGKMKDPKLEERRGCHAGRFGLPSGRVDGDGFTATRMVNRIAIFPRSTEVEFPDLRIVGFQNTREFDSFSPLGALTLPWERNEAAGTVSQMTGLGAGIEGFIAIIPLSENRQFQRAVFVDPARNYVPVRLFEKEIDANGGEQLKASTIVEWEASQDWYVPVSVDMRIYDNIAPSDTDDPSDIMHLAIDWQQVNSVIDPSLFDVAALDIPKGECIVADMRSGKSITLQHPRIPSAEQLRKINEMEANAPDVNSRTGMRNLSILGMFTAANAAILVIIVIARANWLRRASP